MVFDESHHIHEENVKNLLLKDEVPALKVDFFTATPHSSPTLKMKDGICGPEVYKFDHQEAVKYERCKDF